MVDYLKFKNSTPLTRKSKKFDGSRYKEYLYGSVKSLDIDWADKIVDYNPDLKLDTDGLTKYLDRNMSVSTDCGFDNNSIVNSNEVDVYSSDFSIPSNSGSDSLQFINHYQDSDTKYVKTNGYENKTFVSPNENVYGTNYNLNSESNTLNSSQSQKLDELQSMYHQLSSQYIKLKHDYELSLKDAQSYRLFKDKMCVSNDEFEALNDPKDKLEKLLDHIYNVLSEVFGPDNSLVVYLEKFADLYVKHQNNIQVELASLRSKAEVVSNLDKLLIEKSNYEKSLDQKDKTINSLVEELKNSKSFYNSELKKVKDEHELASKNLGDKLVDYEKSLEKYKKQNQSLSETLRKSRLNYKRLLTDQNHLLSQLPLTSLDCYFKVAVNSMPKLPKSNKSSDESSKILPKSVEDSKFYTQQLNQYQNSVSTNANLSPLSYFKQSQSHSLELSNDSILVNSNNFNTAKFLQSMVYSLYKKNEEAIDAINKRDVLIKKQKEVIMRLQNSVNEWESDAVLWLDYLDQSHLLNK